MSKIKVHLKFDKAAMRKAVREVKNDFERRVNKMVERVGRDMAGKPESEVAKRVAREMRKILGSEFKSRDPEIREIAAQIVANNGNVK